MTNVSEEDYFLHGWARLAFWAACDRLLSRKELSHEAYAAAGEALFWACVCDEGYEALLGAQYEEARTSDYNGCLLGGIRWARNRMTHQRAIVLDQLVSQGRHDHGRDIYDERLAGRPVDDAVEACRSWLLGLTVNELSKAAGLATEDLPGLPTPRGDTPAGA